MRRSRCSAPRARGRVPAADFFTGLWDTAIDDDELLTAVSFPVWSGRCGFAVEEVARRHGDFAIAGTALALEVDSGDTVVRCGIGLFGLAPTPVRASAVEAEIVGRHVDEIDAEELGQLAISDLDDVPSDLHSPVGVPPASRCGDGDESVALGDVGGVW